MAISILDGSLKIEVYFEEADNEFSDNVCVRIVEDCPDDERLFRANETNIYITPDEACQLARLFNQAATLSGNYGKEPCV